MGQYQSGYGFIHFMNNHIGIESAIESVKFLSDTVVDNVNYICKISHALERQMSMSSNMSVDSFSTIGEDQTTIDDHSTSIEFNSRKTQEYNNSRPSLTYQFINSQIHMPTSNSYYNPYGCYNQEFDSFEGEGNFRSEQYDSQPNQYNDNQSFGYGENGSQMQNKMLSLLPPLPPMYQLPQQQLVLLQPMQTYAIAYTQYSPQVFHPITYSTHMSGCYPSSPLSVPSHLMQHN